MSQVDLANVGKFFLGFCGYFIGTGLIGMIFAQGDLDIIPTAAWVIGGFAFAVLALFV